ncbi:hypothetical protein EJB05_54928, partial [Eragrostis curvula]
MGAPGPNLTALLAIRRSGSRLFERSRQFCPICRISMKELQAAMPSVRNIQQLSTVPQNSENPTYQWFLPVRQDHRGQNNSPETQESVEVKKRILITREIERENLGPAYQPEISLLSGVGGSAH